MMFINQAILTVLLFCEVRTQDTAVSSGDGPAGTFVDISNQTTFSFTASNIPSGTNYESVFIQNVQNCDSGEVVFVDFLPTHNINEPCGSYINGKAMGLVIKTPAVSDYGIGIDRSVFVYCQGNPGRDFRTKSPIVTSDFVAYATTQSVISIQFECVPDPCIECYDAGKICDVTNNDRTGKTCSCENGATTDDCSEGEPECPCPAGSECSDNGGCVCTAVGNYQFHNNQCIDQDECDPWNNGNTDGCGDRAPSSPYVAASCNNLPGSYECNCRTGFFYVNNRGCRDVNECSSAPNLCGAFAWCANNVGSYTCNCITGYDMVGDRCQDVNECTQLCNGPHDICTNNPGSYVCACSRGYTLNSDRTGCVDIDECATFSHRCGSETECRNTGGSYACDCMDGYIRRRGSSVCMDINECTSNMDSCGSGTECQNTEGSYTCACLDGYRRTSSTVCEDIDECLDSGTCPSDEECTNTPGSYNCDCEDGFDRNDGGVCVEEHTGIIPRCDFCPTVVQVNIITITMTTTIINTGFGSSVIIRQRLYTNIQLTFQVASRSIARSSRFRPARGTSRNLLAMLGAWAHINPRLVF